MEFQIKYLVNTRVVKYWNWLLTEKWWNFLSWMFSKFSLCSRAIWYNVKGDTNLVINPPLDQMSSRLPSYSVLPTFLANIFLDSILLKKISILCSYGISDAIIKKNTIICHHSYMMISLSFWSLCHFWDQISIENDWELFKTHTHKKRQKKVAQRTWLERGTTEIFYEVGTWQGA